LLVGVDKWKRTPSKSTKATSIEPGLPGETDNQSQADYPREQDPLGKLLGQRVLDNNVSWLQFMDETKPPGSFQLRTSRRIMVNLRTTPQARFDLGQDYAAGDVICDCRVDIPFICLLGRSWGGFSAADNSDDAPLTSRLNNHILANHRHIAPLLSKMTNFIPLPVPPWRQPWAGPCGAPLHFQKYL